MSVLVRRSLASRLAALYAGLFAITVIVVIVASSIALVYELSGFSSDIIVAKHQEARFLAGRYASQGIPLAVSAQRIASDLSGIGFRVAIYDNAGHFLGGNPAVRLPQQPAVPAGPPHPWWRVAAIQGGVAVFDASTWIIFTNLIPYWWIILGIAAVAVVLSWFAGRVFSRQALAPVNEVTASLQALADGDFTQRRFVTAGGDEISTLTQAYNEAAASVSSAMDERRETEARMRQFVADAGHELRTPLTVIAGYIDVLRRGAIEEPNVAKQILSTMAIEKEHMRGLIDRLMRLARMEGEAPAERTAINLTELLRGQVEAAKRLDEQREIDYRVDTDQPASGDRAEVSEAIWNVVENALKYAPGAPIHLRAFRENGHAVISVRDEGPGMSESERLHAFERFFRGDARGEIPGSGLGLAIAKRAVDRSRGTIAIESAPGQGVIVRVELPLAGDSQ